MENIVWKDFNALLTEFATNKKYTTEVVNLKDFFIKNKCWKFNEPYCSWDNFTYNLTNVQIKNIFSVISKMIDLNEIT